VQTQVTNQNDQLEDKELMCDGKNLYEIPGATALKYARNILNAIFTPDEIKSKKLPGNRKLMKLDDAQLNEQQLDTIGIKLTC
ncbi:unnamed protein product, partial [Didymodactylos carnosus]